MTAGRVLGIVNGKCVTHFPLNLDFFFFLGDFVQPIIVKFAIFSDLVDKKKFSPRERQVKYCSGLVVSILSPLHNYFLHALVFVKLRERHPAIL